MSWLIEIEPIWFNNPTGRERRFRISLFGGLVSWICKRGAL